MTANTTRYETLDGLRGVAAVAVALFHGASIFGVALPGGYLAVDFFFMLSGFVMHHAYGRKLDAGMTPMAFMTMRILRLYPLYALGLLMAVVLAFATHKMTISLLAASAVGVTGLPFPPVGFGYTLYPLNGPAWSLLYELIANLLMVLTWRFLSNRVLILTCLAGIAALIVCALFYPTMDHGLRWTDAPVSLARVLFGFAGGLLVYRLVGRAQTPSWLSYLLPVILVGLFAAPAADTWIVGLPVVVVIFPILLFLGGATTSQTGLVTRLWVILGLASYPLYMIHRPILRAIEVAFPSFNGLLAAAIVVPLLVAASYGLAVAFDAPLQRLIKTRSSRWVTAITARVGAG